VVTGTSSNDVVRSRTANVYTASFCFLFGLVATTMALLPGVVVSSGSNRPEWLVNALIVPPAALGLLTIVLSARAMRVAVVVSAHGLVVRRLLRTTPLLWDEVVSLERVGEIASSRFYLPASMLIMHRGGYVQGPGAMRSVCALIRRVAVWAPSGHPVRRQLDPRLRNLRPGDPLPAPPATAPAGPWTKTGNLAMNILTATGMVVALALPVGLIVAVLKGLGALDTGGAAVTVVAIGTFAVFVVVRCVRQAVWYSADGMIDRGIFTSKTLHWNQVTSIRNQASGAGSLPVIEMLDGRSRRLGGLATFRAEGSRALAEIRARHEQATRQLT